MVYIKEGKTSKVIAHKLKGIIACNKHRVREEIVGCKQ
jgi:hypothetical protein